jgi:hypothetical protein
VNLQNICKSATVAIFVLVSGISALGQRTVVPVPAPAKLDVVTGNNLYCAGYVQTAPFYTADRKSANRPDKIVGAYNEQDGWLYSQHNDLYVNGGADKGVKVGDMFSVIRPRGKVTSHWSKTHDLGVYVEELGVVEVIRVKQEVSVVRVKNSCSNILLGDLVVPFEQRASIAYVERPRLDRFADPSGKATGRIVMARDHREAPTRDDIIYVDLGSDSAQAGEFVTIFRKLGKGNPVGFVGQNETVSARDGGFASDVYRGGKFSNQAPRKKGENANGHIVTTEDAKEDRPSDLRKVVGEGMIVNVKERVATIVITRTAQEIHTGDWVEIQ